MVDVKEFVIPILLDIGDDINDARVLLVSERNTETLTLPMIELDGKITCAVAIEKFFKKIVPLNVSVDRHFKVYEDDVNGVKYTIKTFVGIISKDKNLSVNLDKMIESTGNVLDIAIFFNILEAIANSKLKDADCPVAESTGDFLSDVVAKLKELFGDGDSGDDDGVTEFNKKIEDMVKGPSASGDYSEVLGDGGGEFLDEYDESKKDRVVEVDFDDIEDVEECKTINIRDANKVFLIFKNVRDMTLTFNGTCLVECRVDKKDKKVDSADVVVGDSKIISLNEAYKNGKISKELFDKNMKKFAEE